MQKQRNTTEIMECDLSIQRFEVDHDGQRVGLQVQKRRLPLCNTE